MNPIHNNPDGVETVPLRAWLEEEIKKEQPAAQNNNNDIESSSSSSQLFILRKTTVAYAVAELLRRAITAAPLSADKISLDNFAVRTKKKDEGFALFSASPSTADILGVDMISEMLSLTVIEPSYMNHLFDEGGEEVGPGRYLEVCISRPLNHLKQVMHQRLNQAMKGLFVTYSEFCCISCTPIWTPFPLQTCSECSRCNMTSLLC